MSPIVEYLHQAGIDFAATLPDSWIHELIIGLESDTRFIHVALSKEEEGVGICAGAYLSGRQPVLIIQNSGLLNCCNALTTLNGLYDIPLLMLVSYRGSLEENSFFHVPLGAVTEPVLDSLRIPFEVISRPGDLSWRIRDTATFARISQRPVALLLTKSSLEAE